MSFAKSACVDGSAMIPAFNSVSLTSLCCRIFCKAALSPVTISGGVLAGAHSPYQVV